MELEVRRAHIAVLFSLLFITIGWIAPATYASYAPDSEFIEVHGFRAEDTTVNANAHNICFDRTVKSGHSGKVYTELYLVNGDSGQTVEVDARTMERYFQEGHHTVRTSFPLPDDLEAGTYQYVLVVEMDLVNGRIEREFSYTSDTFEITEEKPKKKNTTPCMDA